MFATLDPPEEIRSRLPELRRIQSQSSDSNGSHHGSLDLDCQWISDKERGKERGPQNQTTRALTTQKATIFPNADAMKESLREQMTRPRHDVTVYYKTAGFTQAVARHLLFEQITLAVIFLNAMWIWIDTDYNPGSMLLNSPPFFQIVEHVFCVYFCFEWTMRFIAFDKKLNCVKDAWFCFDSFLVATMVFETWLMSIVMIIVSNNGSTATGGLGNAYILRMARLLRLTRMARMVRLLRAAPELLILIKGMIAAMRSVGFTLCLLSVILYVFGIAFVQVCEASECELIFPDVPTTMHTLLLNAALMDSVGSLVTPLGQQSAFLVVLLYAFILIAALTVMNMLIGVICELVSAVAQTEKETLALNYVWGKINELMCGADGADQDEDNLISKEEFLALLTHPSQKAARILQDVNVDVVGLVDFADTIFEGELQGYTEDGVVFEEKRLTFNEFMGIILDLRGGNNATVRDIVNLRKHINGRFDRLEHTLQTAQGLPPRSPTSDNRISPNGHSPSGCNGQSKGAYSCTQQLFGHPFSSFTAAPSPTSMGSNGTVTTTCSYGEDKLNLANQDLTTPKVGEAMPGFQRLVNNLHGLLGCLAAHEVEVSILFSENQKLRDQLAKLNTYASVGRHPGEPEKPEQPSQPSSPARSRWRQPVLQMLESVTNGMVMGESTPVSGSSEQAFLVSGGPSRPVSPDRSHRPNGVSACILGTTMDLRDCMGSSRTTPATSESEFKGSIMHCHQQKC